MMDKTAKREREDEKEKEERALLYSHCKPCITLWQYCA